MNNLYDEVRIIAHGLWQRRWLALAVAWGVCLLGWLVIALVPNQYTATASLYVEVQSVLPDTVGMTPGERLRDIDRVRQTLTSADNLETVVRATNLGRGLSDAQVEAKAAALQNDIFIVQQQDNLFEIEATMHDSSLSDRDNARLSRDIVQKLIDLFVSQNIVGGRKENSERVRFLDAQLAARSKQLQEADQKRNAFEQKYLGSLPGTGSIADRMDAAHQEMGQIETDLMAARSSLSTINSQMAGTPATVPGAAVAGGSAVGPAASQLAQARAELASDRAKGWTDQHPDVVALKSQIANLSTQAAAEARASSSGGGAGRTVNPSYMSLRSLQAERQSGVAALQSRYNQIKADIAKLQAAQSADPKLLAEQGRISRDYEVLKAQYDKLLAEREDAKLRGDVDSETNPVKFHVIEQPVVPSGPTSPNRPLLLAGVLFLGLAAGIGTAFARMQLITTYPTAGRLARASGLPVIGTISHSMTPAARVERVQKRKLFAAGSGALAGLFLLLLVWEFVQRALVA